MNVSILKKEPIIDKSTKHRYAIYKTIISKYQWAKNILDIGPESYLTGLIRQWFPYSIVENTKGDLDIDFTTPKDQYELIIYSHVIEHQFNPLYTLLRLRDVLTQNGLIYIMLPRRGKLLWTNLHYHEIDDYRFRLLIERAGLKINECRRYKLCRPIWQYFTGVRSLLRLIFEFDVVYKVQVPSPQLKGE